MPCTKQDIFDRTLTVCTSQLSTISILHSFYSLITMPFLFLMCIINSYSAQMSVVKLSDL